MRAMRLSLFIVLAALVAGCSTPAPVEPAVDPMSIHTLVASTMQAAATQTQAALPTQTPVPPTATATITATASATAAALPTLPAQPALAGPGTAVALPGSAITAPVPAAAPVDDSKQVKDKAQFLSDLQRPMDDTRFNPYSSFDAVWVFQNVGDTVWNSKYSLRYIQGERFGAEESYPFGKYADDMSVVNGETVTIRVPGLQAAAYEGSQVGYFCLYNNRDDEGLPPQCISVTTVKIWVGPPK